LVIQPREHDLVIGTFGRAAWVLDDIRPLRAMAKNKNITKNKLELFKPPIAYQAAFQQPTGSRFGGDALYNGENRKRGAPISYYINKPIESKKETKYKKQDKKDVNSSKIENKIKYDSIKLEIYDGARLIRTLKHKTPKENGIHKTYWYLSEKGVSRPSRKIRKQKREPSGVRVKPGTYRLKMTFGGQVSEQNIKVEFDPRLTISNDAITQKYNTSKELEGYQKTMANVVKQLVESKNIVKGYKTKLTKEDKKKYREQIKYSLDISKKIDTLIAVFLGKVDKRQGITRNPEVTVSQRLGTARWYVSSRFREQTDTEKQLINQFKTSLKEALEKTNIFFNKDWKEYQKTLETIKISPFKKTEAFSIK
jgi:hypothetical protein